MIDMEPLGNIELFETYEPAHEQGAAETWL